MVIDVGANVGQFAVAILLACDAPRMVCFEPDPVSFARLKSNLSGQPDVRLRQEGAAAAMDRGVLHRHALPLMHSLRPSGPGYRAGDKVEVDLVALDDVLHDVDRVDLLKIDVEGYELDVLRGCTKLLARTRYLCVELGLATHRNADNLDALGLIKEVCPAACIVRTGRPLGGCIEPVCLDVIIDLCGP